jgi:hypothetical protein
MKNKESKIKKIENARFTSSEVNFSKCNIFDVTKFVKKSGHYPLRVKNEKGELYDFYLIDRNFKSNLRYSCIVGHIGHANSRVQSILSDMEDTKTKFVKIKEKRGKESQLFHLKKTGDFVKLTPVQKTPTKKITLATPVAEVV